MKNNTIKLVLGIIALFLTTTVSAQLRTNGVTNEGVINGESPFFDASAYSNETNNGKGIVFPRTDLTTFTFNPTTGGLFSYQTGFDGFIVYNTATGTTPATDSGIGGQSIEPGFYYFSNPGSTGATATGEWLPFVGGSDTKTVVNSTVNETTTIINGTPVNVIRLPGEANGTTTEMDLKTTVLPANSVGELRKAIIYDNTGKLLMTATSDYNSTTNVFTTGDGMVNKLLPAATDYVVELYFLPTP